MSDSWHAPVQKKRSRRKRGSNNESENDSDDEEAKRPIRQRTYAPQEETASRGDGEFPQYTHHHPHHHAPPQAHPHSHMHPYHPPAASHQIMPPHQHWQPQLSQQHYMPPGQQPHYLPPYERPPVTPHTHHSHGPPYYYGTQPAHHEPPQVPHVPLLRQRLVPPNVNVRESPDIRRMTPTPTNILQSPIDTRERKRSFDQHRYFPPMQGHIQQDTHFTIGGLNIASSSMSSSTTAFEEIPSKPVSKEEAIALKRKAKKNAQSRARAAKLREKISIVKQMEEEEKSEDHRKLIDIFEERRRRKNERSRERAIEKKQAIEKILRKPEHHRTEQEKHDLEVAMKAKEKKNKGDRIRRERIKMMGLSKGKKPPLPRGRPRKKKELEDNSNEQPTPSDNTLGEHPVSPIPTTFASPSVLLPSPSSLLMFPTPQEGITDAQFLNALSTPFTPPAAQRPIQSGRRRSSRIQQQQQHQIQRQQHLHSPVYTSAYQERASMELPRFPLTDIHIAPSSAVNLNEVSEFLSELNGENDANDEQVEDESRSTH